MIIWQVELAKGLGFGELSKSEVLKTYMLDKAYQAVRERTPDLGYTFLVGKIISLTPSALSSLLILCRISSLKPCVLQHANKLYFERELKLNECLRLVLADQVLALKSSPI